MKIRVGKNIYLSLTVNRLNNAPEDFTDARNTRVVINRIYSNFQYTPDLTIRDNIISFELPASAGMTTGDYSIHLSYDKLNESSVTGRDTYFLDFCHAFQIVDSTCKEDGCFSVDVPTITFKGTVDVPTIGLNGTIDRDTDGKDGLTPRIDPDTRRWMIGIEDTGIVAEGEDGLTPFIGDNGNWWIGDVDTGKPSRGEAFEYVDFTGEQIKELQKPANEMISSLNETNEAIKINEEGRSLNEGIRQQQETTRVNNEDLRKQAETTRARNEDARNTAESNRVKSEESRGKAESTRIEAEKGRISAESTRVTNENARETAENSRNTAEQGRATAEQNRVTAENERVTEFGRLKTESETATMNANNQGNYAKEQGDNVAGTVQEIKKVQYGLLKRVNDYITDISGLFGKLAVRNDKFTDEKQVTSGKYYDLNGNLVDSISGSYGYQKLDIDNSKVYYLGVLFTGGNISTLVLFDTNGNIIKNYPRVAVKGYYVFEGVASIGISFDMNNQGKYAVQSYDIQDINTVLNTQGNRALYVSAGAVYNETTGFYELNGLTDITEEQMRDIYAQTNHMERMENMTDAFSGLSFRTNLGFNRLRSTNGRIFNLVNAFRENKQLEILRLGPLNNTWPMEISINGNFILGCTKLKSILGFLVFQKSASLNLVPLLEDIRIKKLISNVSIPDSPLLSLESLQYLIDNAINTTAITVTVHPDVYAKIQDSTNIEWHALLSSAQAKNISFATV